MPVLEAFDVADEENTNNPVGLGYILLEKLLGNPLVWQKASEEQIEEILSRCGDVQYITLAKRFFNEIGRRHISLWTRGLEIGPAFWQYDSQARLNPSGRSGARTNIIKHAFSDRFNSSRMGNSPVQICWMHISCI